MIGGSVNKSGKGFRAAFKEATIEERLDALALEGESDVKRSFTTSPSSPGEPPGVLTGALRASIHVEKRGRLQRAIVAGTDYAAHLEFGTTKMAERPFFRPMSMRLHKQIPNFFDNLLD